MTGIGSFFVVVFAIGLLAYHRASLLIWTASLAVLLVLGTRLQGISLGMIVCWLLFIAIFIPLNYFPWRRRLFSTRALKMFRREMPAMSRTEREAITAGTVTWEGDIFRGNPNWNKLLSLPCAKLTEEEQAFLDGPVEVLCGMINDWDITHNRADLPPEVWAFLKEQGFFGLMIPKQYGGKGFSAYAHSQIIIKISGRSITASTTVSVPNSLGPSELLMEYGTEGQKDYYLPKLARGDEIPCFALTSPEAGSDASAMTDYGIVCWGEHAGNKVLGIRLNWNKRYITLAPVATVIGLAFKLYDPDHLIGAKTDIGITCAITLPSSAVGGAKIIAYATGAYARIRRQFHMPIGNFEGIEEPLARIGTYTYIMDAASTFVTSSINQGEKPAVASAIVKYHVTELGRLVTRDAMDIHGGKAICLGPNNYLGRGYESSPIAITVEGANILTRNLIIFGQGALRCHPYVYKEMLAARIEDNAASLVAFDKVVMKHLGFSFSNVVRAFLLGITSGLLVRAPHGKTKRYFQDATRFSSAFALLADAS